MSVLYPIRGVVAMMTIYGFVYNPEYVGNKTFDYAMIDGDAADCVLYKDDAGDYTDIKFEGEDVKNITTLNVTHLSQEVVLQAIQIIEFRKPFGYLNLTDEQVKEIIKDGSVEIDEAEITMPEAVADVIRQERNDTGKVETPSVILIMKEEDKCLIMVKDKELELDDDDE
ncbi:hypothetical protein K1T71_013786 [Dendrolimus kikuchii]|uniref:Uncharacterized protein n=1 Tax=Dendrolimus kikuchii TaxID=765133 RepID=A0ACC1CFP8_9NEOP|nr:hypothetical protein K1T71_013786 [Dendrolimus kikuchii]